MSIFQGIIEKSLGQAGIHVNGRSPWDIHVHHPKFYRQVALKGSLGLGESYMDGFWDCDALDEFICKLLRDNIPDQYQTILEIMAKFQNQLFNLQNIARAFTVGEHHYDIGNNLYQLMLDKGMNYSCGYWEHATTLDEAQEAKLDLVCRKLHLKPGMRVLEIGCGWGGFAKFAAERYGVSVLGITISKEQCQLARRLCQGLPVDIELLDYRHIQGQFDAIVSIGMFEHVGYKNYRQYFTICRDVLKPDGLFLLHTIAGNKTLTHGELWLEKYIFPNGMLPSIVWIGKTSEDLLIMEDWQNFGLYYDKTLLAWRTNFELNWHHLKAQYGERFYRMWRYYLSCCAGGFRSRSIQLWQIVFSKGIAHSYHYEKRIQNPEFRIQNPEVRIQESKSRIQKSESRR